MALKEAYPEKVIERHFKVVLKPKTEIFKEITWAIDFVISHQGDSYFIESKGYSTRDFIYKIITLEYFYPWIYEKIILVYPDKGFSNNAFLRINQQLKAQSFTLSGFRREIKSGSIFTSIAKKEKKEECSQN